jgi:hypothetical protein
LAEVGKMGLAGVIGDCMEGEELTVISTRVSTVMANIFYAP